MNDDKYFLFRLATLDAEWPEHPIPPKQVTRQVRGQRTNERRVDPALNLMDYDDE